MNINCEINSDEVESIEQLKQLLKMKKEISTAERPRNVEYMDRIHPSYLRDLEKRERSRTCMGKWTLIYMKFNMKPKSNRLVPHQLLVACQTFFESKYFITLEMGFSDQS